MILSQTTPPKGTVRDWLDARAEQGGTAFVFPETNEALSWAELRDTAKTLAQGLTAQRVAKGESLAIIHPNGKDGVVALYAALYGGFRATMINLAAGPDAIAYALNHSGARFALVHDAARNVQIRRARTYESAERFARRSRAARSRAKRSRAAHVYIRYHRQAQRRCAQPCQLACRRLDDRHCSCA